MKTGNFLLATPLAEVFEIVAAAAAAARQGESRGREAAPTKEGRQGSFDGKPSRTLTVSIRGGLKPTASRASRCGKRLTTSERRCQLGEARVVACHIVHVSNFRASRFCGKGGAKNARRMAGRQSSVVIRPPWIAFVSGAATAVVVSLRLPCVYLLFATLNRSRRLAGRARAPAPPLLGTSTVTYS